MREDNSSFKHHKAVWPFGYLILNYKRRNEIFKKEANQIEQNCVLRYHDKVYFSLLLRWAHKTSSQLDAIKYKSNTLLFCCIREYLRQWHAHKLHNLSISASNTSAWHGSRNSCELTQHLHASSSSHLSSSDSFLFLDIFKMSKSRLSLSLLVCIHLFTLIIFYKFCWPIR